MDVVRFSVYRNGRTPDDGGSDKSYPLEYEEALAELMELLMRGHYLSEMSEKERRIVLKLGEGSSAERSYFYADDMLDFFFLDGPITLIKTIILFFGYMRKKLLKVKDIGTLLTHHRSSYQSHQR